MITIFLVAFVALLLLGSIAAFFLCFPIVPAALVAVILLGMALLFLLGCWVGAMRVLEIGPTGEGIRRRRRIRLTAESDTWSAAKDGLQPDLVPVSNAAIEP